MSNPISRPSRYSENQHGITSSVDSSGIRQTLKVDSSHLWDHRNRTAMGPAGPNGQNGQAEVGKLSDTIFRPSTPLPRTPPPPPPSLAARPANSLTGHMVPEEAHQLRKRTSTSTKRRSSHHHTTELGTRANGPAHDERKTHPPSEISVPQGHRTDTIIQIPPTNGCLLSPREKRPPENRHGEDAQQVPEYPTPDEKKQRRPAEDQNNFSN